MNTSENYKAIAGEFARELRRRLGDRPRVLLYGSVARGEATERSDIDLAVVHSEDDPAAESVELDLAVECMDRHGVLVAVNAYTPAQFERLQRFPLGWQMLREGVWL